MAAATLTCDLRDVRDGEPLGVVARRHQTLGHVGRLEVERPVVSVQSVRESGREEEEIII